MGLSLVLNAQTVTIGTQVWMTKNLDVAKFRNGDPIPEAKTDEEWEKAGENKQPAWCNYDNNPANGTKYGKLYNWHAVNDPRGLAPEGYHVPTDAEWTILENFLGSDAEKKMQIPPVIGPTIISYVDQGGYYAQNWVVCSNCKVASPEYKKICPSCKGMGGRNVQGNYIPKTKRKVETKGENSGWFGDNSSGFSGLPGGYRDLIGRFYGIGYSGYWWSSTEYSTESARHRDLRDGDFYGGVGTDFDDKGSGFSVRCVKD